MINGEKIGVGIVTCNRESMLHELLGSLEKCWSVIDENIIINDGMMSVNTGKWLSINHDKNLGVAKSKNEAILFLSDLGCDHIFIIEDDMHIKDASVFEKYVEASKVSGIQHFNYGPGSPFNRKQNIQFDLDNRHLLDQKSDPNPKLIIDYDGVKLDFYEHTVAMFTYYSKKCIETVGYIDESYHNAWEHVDHTYEIIKAGLHPPFWYFADIHNSVQYLEEQEDAINNSSIACDKEQWTKNVMGGREIYKTKHGHYPNQPPVVNEEETLKIIKSLKP